MEIYKRQDNMSGQHMHIIDMHINYYDAMDLFGKEHFSIPQSGILEEKEWRWELFNGIKFSIEMSNSEYGYKKGLEKIPFIEEVNIVVIKGELNTINMLREYFSIQIGKNGNKHIILNYIFGGEYA